MNGAVPTGATLSVLLLLACASSSPEPPRERAERSIPERPSGADVELESPPSPIPAERIPWIQTRPNVRVRVRAPEAAVRQFARRSESELTKSRRRLQGAWSFVVGETIGMAIFDRSGRFLLQAVGGEVVSFAYRVVRPPGPDPGRLQLRMAADSSGPPGETSGSGEVPLRFRALFEWRSDGRVDLQVPRPGEPWPETFDDGRLRLFKDVEDAVRHLRRRERGLSGASGLHAAD